MDHLNKDSLDLTKENIEQLKKIFPNIVIDGKVDFEKLRLILGDDIDTSNEKYCFCWNGKAKTLKFSQQPSTATLIPCRGKSKDWDKTNNIYIEGDNAEVLKVLQKTYNKKIKMIYIDPPYNTGNDFVYKDDFKDSLGNYINSTNQKQHSNPETSGRFHTDWLNMMYLRLILSKNLLTDDGAIFVSIDDNEATNIKKLLDEIYGENNKVAEFVVIRSEGGGMAKQVVKGHDYLYVYAKNIDEFKPLGKPKDVRGQIIERNGEKYWIQEDWLRKEFGKYGNCHYEEILEFKGQEKLDEINQGLEEGKYVLIPKNNGMNIVGKLRNLREDSSKFYSIIKHLSANGIKDLEKLGLEKYFSYPKPLSLLIELISGMTKFSYDKNDIILDFFSGSATTAQAVMHLNLEDNGNRQFIMVQLPEVFDENSIMYSEGYNNICDVGQERIRRAGKYELECKSSNDGLFSLIDTNTDLGFKVFKLESTNIKPWDGEKKVDENTIFDFTDTIKDDRTNLDVAYEIMLKYGIFNMPLKEVQINNKTMYNIGEGYMMICLDNDITSKDVMEIANLKPHCVVFKEQGFADDNEKINATYTLERLGVEDVKCI